MSKGQCLAASDEVLSMSKCWYLQNSSLRKGKVDREMKRRTNMNC